MSPEMYMVLGVGVGLAGLILTLFIITWRMMDSQFNRLSSDMNAWFDSIGGEVNARFDSTGGGN